MVSHSGSPGPPLPWCPELQVLWDGRTSGALQGHWGVQAFLPDASGPRSLCLSSGAQHPLLAAPWNKPSAPPPQQASGLQPLLGNWSRNILSGLCSPVSACGFPQARSWTSYPCALAAEGDPPALRHLPSWANSWLCCPQSCLRPVWRPGWAAYQAEEQVGALVSQGRQPRPCPGAGTPDRHPVPR